MILESVHQTDLAIWQSNNLAGKKLVRPVNYIQQIVKIKTPRYPTKFWIGAPVVINKKPENQHNFQRFKHHAVNDRNIRHEGSRLGKRRKSKRITMFSDSIPKEIRIRELKPTQLLDWKVFLELPQMS